MVDRPLSVEGLTNFLSKPQQHKYFSFKYIHTRKSYNSFNKNIDYKIFRVHENFQV